MSIKIMSAVWEDSTFKGTTLLCLLTLADHANDDGFCWPSYERIAKRARCDRRQAMRCIATLRAAGWVEVIGRKPTDNGQFVNLYRVRLKKGGDGKGDGKMSPPNPPGGNVKVVAGSHHLLTKGGDKKGGGGGRIGKKVVVPVSPKPSGESSIEPLPWGDEPNQAKPTLEQAHMHLLATTDLDALAAMRCCDRWVAGVRGGFENWEESLSAFAAGFPR